MIVHWVYIRQIWRPLVLCDDIWTVWPAASSVRCVCWRRFARRWIRWAAGDCSLRRDLEADGQRNTRNQLLLSLRQNAAILCHLVTGFWKLDSIFSLNNFNAEKSVGGHVKKSITSLFFNRITFHLAVRCWRFQQIKLENFKLEFQTVAEKTVKNFRGYFILPHPVLQCNHFDIKGKKAVFHSIHKITFLICYLRISKDHFALSLISVAISFGFGHFLGYFD